MADNKAVIDGMTGNTMDVTKQAISITMLTHSSAHPHQWTTQVDLRNLTEASQLAAAISEDTHKHGENSIWGSAHPTDSRLFSIVAEAGTGKTWLTKQLLYHLLCKHRDERQQVALCITVQSIAFEHTRQAPQGQQSSHPQLDDFGGDVLEWYVPSLANDLQCHL